MHKPLDPKPLNLNLNPKPLNPKLNARGPRKLSAEVTYALAVLYGSAFATGGDGVGKGLRIQKL